MLYPFSCPFKYPLIDMFSKLSLFFPSTDMIKVFRFDPIYGITKQSFWGVNLRCVCLMLAQIDSQHYMIDSPFPIADVSHSHSHMLQSEILNVFMTRILLALEIPEFLCMWVMLLPFLPFLISLDPTSMCFRHLLRIPYFTFSSLKYVFKGPARTCCARKIRLDYDCLVYTSKWKTWRFTIKETLADFLKLIYKV